MGVITIDKDGREVGDEQGSDIRIQIATNKCHRCERNKEETDKARRVRVQAKVNKLRVSPRPRASSAHLQHFGAHWRYIPHTGGCRCC